MARGVKKYLKLFLKIIGWTIVSIIGLLLIVIIALQLPMTQNFLTGKAENFLQDKLQTEVSIGGIYFTLPGSLRIKDFYLEDREQDTLVYSNLLKLNVNLLSLINNKIDVSDIVVSNFYGHIERKLPDTTFNYNFIIESFATDTTAQKPVAEDTAAGGGWEISVGEIDFEDFRFAFDDELMGMHAYVNLGDLNVDMEKIDLGNNAYLVDQITLENSSGYYRVTKFVPDTAQTEDTTALELGINKIDIANVDFSYEDQVAGQSVDLLISEFLADAKNFSLAKQEILLNKLLLNNSNIIYVQNQIPVEDSLMLANQNVDTTETEETPPWHIAADEIQLANNTVQYHDYYSPELEDGLDFSHLTIQDLTLEMDNFEYQGMDIYADINQFSFQEESGFAINEFKTELTFTDNKTTLENLYIETNNSVIQRHLAVFYPSLSGISENLGEIRLDIDLVDTKIGEEDILYFMPDLATTPPFDGNKNIVFEANANVSGLVSDLDINSFNVRTLGNTRFALQGQISGLPDMDQAYFNINQFRVNSTASDLKALFIPDSIADQYDLPNQIVLTADFEGSLDDFTLESMLNTSLGNISADLNMNPGEQYTGTINVNDLQLGTIMKNDTTYGPLTLEATIDGQGFALESMNSQIDLLVEQVVYNQYSYEGLSLEGTIDSAVFNGHIAYEDSSLNFNFDGIVSLDPDTPRYDLTLNLVGANLKDLNFSQNLLTVQGTFEADLTGSNINNINGNAGVRDVLIVKNDESYRIDSLLFASITGDERTQINIDSDLLSAHFEGTINLGDLAGVLQNHFNRYYNLQDVAVREDTLRRQNFEFEIQLHNPELLTNVLVPQIENFVPGYITGSFDSRENNLMVDILIPQLDMGTFSIDTLTFHVDSDADFLNYGASVAEFLVAGYSVNNLAVVGQVYDDLIETRLQITDEESQIKYSIGGLFRSLENVFRFSIEPAEAILNYDEWQLPEENYVELSSKPVYINEMVFTKDDQQMAINTTVQNADSVLNINFENFALKTFSNIASGDTTLLEGLMNGSINLSQGAPQMVFTSDLNINNLALMGSELGNMALLAENTTGGRINLDAALTGNENNIQINGYLQPTDDVTQLNLTADVNQANLVTFAGPLQGTLSELEGYMQGQLNISGTTEQPEIRGSIGFNNAHFFVEYLQTAFNIDNEQIVFNDRGIGFNQFEIVDISGNEALINGYILTTNYTDFNFDLTVDANNFEVLNTAEDDNQMYYGHVVINAEMQITGSMLQPDVAMEVEVLEETNITYSLAESQPAVVEIEGLVRFVDRDKETNNQIIAEAKEEAEGDTVSTELQGINLTANILVNNGATLKIVIDPATGDYLITQANRSSLSLNMDQVGNINLTGTFEIADGAYHLSFQEIIKRTFAIRSGSQITWTGNPLDANLDITAIYTVQTSPEEIMAQTDVGQTPRYSKRIPAQVMLNIDGDIMDPDISFDLGVAAEADSEIAAEVRRRLQGLNEADVNKQVFALLVLQRFISENPLESSGGGGISSTARNSVSSILNSQLNKFAQRIKGFNLSFDLQSYETGEGAQTELDVNLSRSFFNDRLNVKVGGNIDLEQQNEARSAQQTGLGNYVGDIAIEYKLTPTGNLLLEVFREQTYETFYNEVVRTGIGIIYNRNYNRFKELFNPGKEEDEEADIENTVGTKEERD